MADPGRTLCSLYCTAFYFIPALTCSATESCAAATTLITPLSPPNCEPSLSSCVRYPSLNIRRHYTFQRQIFTFFLAFSARLLPPSQASLSQFSPDLSRESISFGDAPLHFSRVNSRVVTAPIFTCTRVLYPHPLPTPHAYVPRAPFELTFSRRFPEAVSPPFLVFR